MTEDISDWIPDHNDFSLGRALIVIEDYSRVVQRYGMNDMHFTALLYSVLSLREQFAANKKQFNEFLCANLWTANSVLENKEVVFNILDKYGLAKKKTSMVYSIAESWDELNLTERMREDPDHDLGFQLREEMNEVMIGVGFKFASLFIRMSGYENIVPIDSWATKFVESRGFKFRNVNSGLKSNQYLKYEEKITEYANELNVSPALLQATIYAKWSTWVKDSKVIMM